MNRDMSHRALARRARHIAAELDRGIDRARAPNLDREIDRDIALTLDRAYALARALDRSTAEPPPAPPHELVRDLIQQLARARHLACNRPRARNLVRPLDRARSRARHLARSLCTAGDMLVVDVGAGPSRSPVGTELERRSLAGAVSGSVPSRVQEGLVAVTLSVLPDWSRQRYAEELRAELAELAARDRLGHALRVLRTAWLLRRALRGASGEPAGEQEGNRGSNRGDGRVHQGKG